VRGLLNEATYLYRDSPRATSRLRRQLSRFTEPLRIAVAGPPRSGKSTLINAIMGAEIAPVEIADGRSVLTWYEDGPEAAATGYSSAGPAVELPVVRSAGGMRVDLAERRTDDISEIIVTWPTRALRHVSLVEAPTDTGSDKDGRMRTTAKVLRNADAVLYLTRDARGSDLDLLRQAQEGLVASTVPPQVILVLSRADEIGGGQMDSFLAGRQLARQLQRNPAVDPLCLSVVPVGGLVALAGRLLSEPEFTALSAMAATPRGELDAFLLSTDRFVGAGFPVSVDVETRQALLERLGISGVRLAATLIRAGNDTRAGLAAELVRRSGLTELRESISRYLVDRREALMARSALVALDATLRSEPSRTARKLHAEMERILVATHDFQELSLLAALPGPRLRFDEEEAAEVYRLVGGNGTDPAARLGVDYAVSNRELVTLGAEALRRWQHKAESPLVSLDQRRAARIVVRSCESMLARLPQPGDWDQHRDWGDSRGPDPGRDLDQTGQWSQGGDLDETGQRRQGGEWDQTGQWSQGGRRTQDRDWDLTGEWIREDTSSDAAPKTATW